MNRTPRSTPRVVIVGGGFAGLAATRALRSATAEVLLVDKHNYHLFQPLLYQIATAVLSPASIAAPIRGILTSQRNCKVIMSEVREVEVGASRLRIGEEPYIFDYLVLATGAVTNYFGNDEWSRYAPGLKTIDDALNIRSRFLLSLEQAEIENDPSAQREALTFAIVGAGPTGVEVAGAIAELSRLTVRHDFRNVDTNSVRIILIDFSDRVLHAFAPELSTRAQRDLEALGVEVLLGTKVVDVGKRGLTIESSQGKRHVGAQNVLWTAGVEASPLGAALGVETDSSGRVVVGDDLTIPSYPNVFVVGDLACRIDPKSGKEVPGLAQGAMQMGRFAGRTISAEIAASAAGISPPKRPVFVYKDKGMMAIIGRNRAVAQTKRLRFGGAFAFLVWAFVHILFLISFRRKLLVFFEWGRTYFFHRRGARLITGDERTPKPVKLPPDPRKR